MATDVRSEPEHSVTSLVTGIVDDIRDLLRQQVALLKHEIKEDLQRAKEASLAFLAGAGIVLIGVLQLAWMLPHLLNWAVPTLPLWSCFGIVGALFAAIGGGVLYAGKKKIADIHPLPEQSVEALKENLSWTTNRK